MSKIDLHSPSVCVATNLAIGSNSCVIFVMHTLRLNVFVENIVASR